MAGSGPGRLQFTLLYPRSSPLWRNATVVAGAGLGAGLLLLLWAGLVWTGSHPATALLAGLDTGKTKLYYAKGQFFSTPVLLQIRSGTVYRQACQSQQGLSTSTVQYRLTDPFSVIKKRWEGSSK